MKVVLSNDQGLGARPPGSLSELCSFLAINWPSMLTDYYCACDLEHTSPEVSTSYLRLEIKFVS